MNESTPALKVFAILAGGRRGRGTLPLRWKDQVEKDLTSIGVSNWHQTANKEEKTEEKYFMTYIRVKKIILVSGMAPTKRLFFIRINVNINQ